MSKYLLYNGRIVASEASIISSDNRGLRYGEGFFETIKVSKGIIALKNLHFERILKSFSILGFEMAKAINLDVLELKINQLLIKNNHLTDARVRCMFIRKSGGINDEVSSVPDYIIESEPITLENKLNANGLELQVYHGAIKSCDLFSNIKSNNFLAYVMAAKYAKTQKVNDAIILNMYGRICDTSIANIFIIKDEQVLTPALEEGCIEGVMRRYIIENLNSDYNIIECPITIEELMDADEVFLSNAIRGIRWVKFIEDKKYGNKKVKEIFKILNRTN